MNFTSEELKYLNRVLECASSYTIARAEQFDFVSVSHKKLQQKIKDKIHRMCS